MHIKQYLTYLMNYILISYKDKPGLFLVWPFTPDLLMNVILWFNPYSSGNHQGTQSPPYHGRVTVSQWGKYVYISINIYNKKWHVCILHFPWKSNCVANTINNLFSYTRWLIYIDVSDLPSFTDKYAMILYKCYDQLLQSMTTYL